MDKKEVARDILKLAKNLINRKAEDDDMPESVKELAKEQDYELDDVTYTDEGDYYKVEMGSEEWMVFEDSDKAEKYAVDQVKDMIEDEPETFNKDFIKQHVFMTDTDARLTAQDMAESYRESLSDDEDLTEDEIDEKVEEYEDEIEKKLNDDPISYFVDEEGIYTEDELLKQNFIRINAEEAAQEAVNIDGVAHFLSGYDGNETELDSGAVAYRTN